MHSKHYAHMCVMHSQYESLPIICNIQRFFSEEKNENFIGKIFDFFIFSLKTYIVPGTR